MSPPLFANTVPMDTQPPPSGSLWGDSRDAISPSLMQDLSRFDPVQGAPRALLEVLAACVRHTQPLALRLGRTEASQDLTLTVFPRQRLVRCPLAMAEFESSRRLSWPVLSIDPTRLTPPPEPGAQASHAGLLSPASPHQAPWYPLAPLLWAVALGGERWSLLPELDGQAAYRVAPGTHLAGLDVPGAMQVCITRLRRETCNLRDIADWRQIGNERAMRLLNALYLQSALIVSRSHPAATTEGWAGYRR